MFTAKVLVLDDFKIARDNIVGHVKQIGKGITIESTDNIYAAQLYLEKASQSGEPFDFFVTDLAVGKLSVEQGIKKNHAIGQKYPDLKIIAVSGKETSAIPVFNAGAFAFFRKPYYSDLKKTIRYWKEIKAVDEYFRVSRIQTPQNTSRYFNKIVDDMNIGISVVDQRMRLLYMNQRQAEMSKLQSVSSEIIGGLCYETFENGAYMECPNCPVRRLFNGEENPHYTFVRQTGHHRVTVLPLIKENKTVIAAIEIAVDVTDREEFDTFRKGLDGELKSDRRIGRVLEGIAAREYSRSRMLLLTDDRKFVQGFSNVGNELSDFGGSLEPVENVKSLQSIIRKEQSEIFKIKRSSKVPFWQAAENVEMDRQKFRYGLVPMNYAGIVIGAIYVDDYSPIAKDKNGDIIRRPRKISEEGIVQLQDFAAEGARAVMHGRQINIARQAIELMKFDKEIYEKAYERDELFEKLIENCIRIIGQQFQFRIIPKKAPDIYGHVMKVEGRYLKRVVQIGQTMHNYLMRWNLETDNAVPSVKAFRTGKEVVFNLVQGDPEWEKYLQLLEQSGKVTKDNIKDNKYLKSVACFPIKTSGKTVGMLGIQSLAPNLFNTETLDLVRAFVQRTANAVQAHLSLEKMRRYPHMSETMAHAKAVSSRYKNFERTIFALLLGLTHPEGLAFDRAIFFKPNNDQFKAIYCITSPHDEGIREVATKIPFPDMANGPIRFNHLPEDLPVLRIKDLPSNPVVIGKKETIIWQPLIKYLDTKSITFLPIGDLEDLSGLCIMDNYATNKEVSKHKLKMLEAINIDYRTLFNNLDMIRQIENENRHRGELLHVLTHRLGTDISGVYEWVKRTIQKKQDLSSNKLSIIADKLWRTHADINEVLTFSVIEDGKLESQAHFAVFSLGSIVEEAANEVFAFELERISMSLSAGIWVKGDRRLLKHALLNLLDNAANYSKEKTLIYISTSKTSGKKKAAVAIKSQPKTEVSEKELQTIFEKFSRGENARYAKGTGLGLYIVDHVAKAHGGRAQATLDGEGCITFSLIIPCYK